MARKLVGTVASDVQDKTIIVAVARRVTHPIYGKQYTVTKRFAAHDEDNQAHVGDRVELLESRPISKRKTWRLSRIIETGHAAVELKDDAAEAIQAAAQQTPKTDKPARAKKAPPVVDSSENPKEVAS
jgi:small subunit ribosomal protein S17